MRRRFTEAAALPLGLGLLAGAAGTELWRAAERSPLAALLLVATALAALLEWRRRAALHELARARDALDQSEALLRAAFDDSPVAMGFFAPDGTVLAANRAGRERLGMEVGAALLEGPVVRCVHPDDERRVHASFARALRGEGEETVIDYRWVEPGGRVEWTQATLSPVRRADGVLRFVTGMIELVAQRGEADERIRQLAFYDDVTGLGNRSYLIEHLEAAIVRAREARHTLGVLFLDLDGFKHVNDTLGHDAGDEVLVETAQRFASCLRNADGTARHADELHLSRFGGDEFVMLLPAVEGPRGCAIVANRLLTSLESPVEVRGEKAQIGVSIGIAVYPDDGQSVNELLRAADDAMYVAKERPGSAYAFCRDARPAGQPG